MKKFFLIFLGLISLNAYAAIPYCPGTTVDGGKHHALQFVVKAFADENHCVIGSNCLLNFDKIKYSIAWAKNCWGSAQRNNDPKGSTFICGKGANYN